MSDRITNHPPQGVILWRGASLPLGSYPGGDEIAVAVTGIVNTSTNRKTGPMLQSYILRVDGNPMENLKSGADRAICGDCPMRGGACYVDVSKGPNQVWKRLDVYPHVSRLSKRIRNWCFQGRPIRIGAYGDPAAVPFEVWEEVVAWTGEGLHTGYTSSWRTCDQRLREICVASVRSPEEAELADSMGWQYFRVREADEPLGPGEFVCPASNEAKDEGSKSTCFSCMACRGRGKSDKKRPSAVVVVHGAPYKVQRFAEVRVSAAASVG